MEIDFKGLQDRFPAEELEWRLQQAGETNGRVWALCVPYVTNRAIQGRLDDVCGAGGWKNEFRPGPDGGVLCGISIRVDGEWVTKWDGAENTDIESVKGGLSGAMKRAAVQWGIGRFLYALDETFANVHEGGAFRGKTKDGKPFKWDPPQLPKWALPEPQPKRAAEPAQRSAAQRDPGATKMPAGEHKDVPLRDVPTPNLRTALEHYRTKPNATELVEDMEAVLRDRDGGLFPESAGASSAHPNAQTR